MEKKYIKLNNIDIDSIISQNIETHDLEFKENFNPKEKSFVKGHILELNDP